MIKVKLCFSRVTVFKVILSIPVNLRTEGGTRRGNMGHLTRIANMVVQNLEKGPVQAQITDLIKGELILYWAGCQISHLLNWKFSDSYHPAVVYCCRAARGLQRSLGEFCGRDPERD